MTDLAIGWVSPFGHPGITAHVQLPQAYRSLSRPSSPLDAKASTVCLIAFDLKFVGVASSRDGKTQPVLIPHTRLRPTLRWITDIPSNSTVVKEQVGSR